MPSSLMSSRLVCKSIKFAYCVIQNTKCKCFNFFNKKKSRWGTQEGGKWEKGEKKFIYQIFLKVLIGYTSKIQVDYIFGHFKR